MWHPLRPWDWEELQSNFLVCVHQIPSALGLTMVRTKGEVMKKQVSSYRRGRGLCLCVCSHFGLSLLWHSRTQRRHRLLLPQICKCKEDIFSDHLPPSKYSQKVSSHISSMPTCSASFLPVDSLSVSVDMQKIFNKYCLPSVVVVGNLAQDPWWQLFNAFTTMTQEGLLKANLGIVFGESC